MTKVARLARAMLARGAGQRSDKTELRRRLARAEGECDRCHEEDHELIQNEPPASPRS